jgi:hypothetical protein
MYGRRHHRDRRSELRDITHTEVTNGFASMPEVGNHSLRDDHQKVAMEEKSRLAPQRRYGESITPYRILGSSAGQFVA